MPHTMHPQAMLSEFDETWNIYIVRMALLQEMEYFLICASTSGVRAPPGAEAPFYSLQGKLLCNLSHFYLPFISKAYYK